MEWLIPFITVLGVFIANAALLLPLFLWNRAEARAGIRHMDAKLDSNRELVREMHNESRALVNAIHLEMKDFHVRLISVEQQKKTAIML